MQRCFSKACHLRHTPKIGHLKIGRQGRRGNRVAHAGISNRLTQSLLHAQAGKKTAGWPWLMLQGIWTFSIPAVMLISASRCETSIYAPMCSSDDGWSLPRLDLGSFPCAAVADRGTEGGSALSLCWGTAEHPWGQRGTTIVSLAVKHTPFNISSGLF